MFLLPIQVYKIKGVARTFHLYMGVSREVTGSGPLKQENEFVEKLKQNELY